MSPATVSSLAKVHPGNGEPSCNGDQPNGDDPSDGDPSGSDPSGSEPSSVGLDTGQGHHPAACAMGLTLNTGQSRHSSSGTKGLDTGTTRPVLQPATGEEKKQCALTEPPVCLDIPYEPLKLQQWAKWTPHKPENEQLAWGKTLDPDPQLVTHSFFGLIPNKTGLRKNDRETKGG